MNLIKNANSLTFGPMAIPLRLACNCSFSVKKGSFHLFTIINSKLVSNSYIRSDKVLSEI